MAKKFWKHPHTHASAWIAKFNYDSTTEMAPSLRRFLARYCLEQTEGVWSKAFLEDRDFTTDRKLCQYVIEAAGLGGDIDRATEDPLEIQLRHDEALVEMDGLEKHLERKEREDAGVFVQLDHPDDPHLAGDAPIPEGYQFGFLGNPEGVL